MRPIQFTRQGLLKRSFKTLLVGVMAAFLCMAVSVRATLIPLPKICITDNDNGTTPSVVITDLGLITLPPGDPTQPSITSGIGKLEIQFFTDPVFFPIPGQTAVILKDLGTGNPSDIVILTVSALLGKNSVDVYFADAAAANFSTLLLAWGGIAPTVFETGVQQDVSPLLYSSEEVLAICVGCGGQSVPDSGSTLALLGLALAGVVLMPRLIIRQGKGLR